MPYPGNGYRQEREKGGDITMTNVGPYPTDEQVAAAQNDVRIAEPLQLVGAMGAALKILAARHRDHGPGCADCRTIRCALTEYQAWRTRPRMSAGDQALARGDR